MKLSLDYEQMVQKALLQVVKDALQHAADKGLPGSHHFYLTFQTNRPDVDMSPRLKETYPEDMTIVLQHQFWDLTITDTFFSVVLSFDDIHEKITVPFVAMTHFLDPSVKFGLEFEPEAPSAPTLPQGEKKASSGNSSTGKVVALDAFRKK